jgi:hypothetical protein
MGQSLNVGVAVLLAGGLILANPVVAFSATDEEIAESLLETTAESLGIVVTDDALAEILVDDLQYALEEDVVDPELADAVSETIDEGLEVELADDLAENLLEQNSLWLEESGELKAGLEVVKQEFYQCRASTDGPANECARGFGLQIQVALAESQLQQVEQLQARLGELSGDELAQAEAELLQAQERLTLRIEIVEQKIVRTEARGDNADSLKDSLRKIEPPSSSDEPRGRSTQSPQNESVEGGVNEAPGNAPTERGNASEPRGNAGGQSGSSEGRGR